MTMENVLVAALWALTPTALLGLFFYFIIRLILRTDRNERAAFQKVEREERARLGLPQKDAAPASSTQ